MTAQAGRKSAERNERTYNLYFFLSFVLFFIYIFHYVLYEVMEGLLVVYIYHQLSVIVSVLNEACKSLKCIREHEW